MHWEAITVLSKPGAIQTIAYAAILFVSAGSPLTGNSQEIQADLSGVVKSEGVDPENAALLIVRLEDGAEWTSGAARIETPYPPASTSKIPHTLIALETGYADGPNTVFKWDGTKRFFEAWNQDQTLSSAFKYSTVWVYQQITRELGYDTMSEWMSRLGYGNSDIGTPDDLTTYWLVGPLETSARNQVEFLSKLASETLPFTADTYLMGKQIMQADQGDDWTLFAKSGWRMDRENTDIGWYVGWVDHIEEGQEHTYVFAFNMDMAEASDRARRQAVVRSALTYLGIISD